MFGQYSKWVEKCFYNKYGAARSMSPIERSKRFLLGVLRDEGRIMWWWLVRVSPKKTSLKEVLNNRNSITRVIAVAAGLLAVVVPAAADTPKLNISTKNGTAIEEQKKEQIERLAKQYDLKKWTITRDIIVEQGARPHSSPVLTLNSRFLDDDDVALSVYVHEQGHWLLMERHRAHINELYADLKRAVPGLPSEFPQGSGDERGTRIHLAVIMLEWQGMEELVGAERARKVMDLQKTDHYTAIYSAVLEHREALEKILHRYSVKW